MTIQEKFGFHSWEDIKAFLDGLFEKRDRWTFMKPSGYPFTVEKDYFEHLNFWQMERAVEEVSRLPYYEKLPAMEELYALIPENMQSPAVYMKWLDKCYSIFSSAYVTGAEKERTVSEVFKCYEASGELVVWLNESEQEILVIPENIRKIKREAFTDHDSMIHVIIPKEVEIVEAESFVLDDIAIEDHKLLFIEVQGENTELSGCPYSNYVGECFSEYPFIYILAPAGSKAMLYALEHDFLCAVSMADAIGELLDLGKELENTRDEIAGFYDTALFLRKAELAIEYGLKYGVDPKMLVFGFCRMAFFVSERIRSGYFEPKKAISYLKQYDLLKDLMRECLLSDEWKEGFAWVRVLAALKKYDFNAYQKFMPMFFAHVDSDMAVDYVYKLGGDDNFNLEWTNMFYGGNDKDYDASEFWKLGQEIADIFIVNRLPEWEEILETCEWITEKKTEKERYGYFSEEWFDILRGDCEEIEEDE